MSEAACFTCGRKVGPHAQDCAAWRSIGPRNAEEQQAFDRWKTGALAAATPEPPPVANDHPPLWPMVIDDIKRLGDGRLKIVALVVADMEARDAFGLAKYKTRLQPFNGRDMLVDLLQEGLDAAVYARGCLAEEIANGAEMEDDYREILRLVVRLRARLYLRDGK